MRTNTSDLCDRQSQKRHFSKKQASQKNRIQKTTRQSLLPPCPKLQLLIGRSNLAMFESSYSWSLCQFNTSSSWPIRLPNHHKLLPKYINTMQYLLFYALTLHILQQLLERLPQIKITLYLKDNTPAVVLYTRELLTTNLGRAHSFHYQINDHT